MAVELATAYLALVPSMKGAQGAIAQELTGASAAGASAGKSLGGKLVGGLSVALGPVAGIMAGVFGAKAVIGWGREQVAALSRIEEINAQTEAAIRSTGGAANVSRSHIEGLAGSLEGLTGTEAESIQQGANLLLTFKNIQNGVGEGNDIFDQATTSLVDMARAMGTEPQAAAIQLGKALNDPVAGISALSRVGIQFTDDQKSLIQSLVDSGQTMEAQKIILAELNSQFGGSGAAYAETYAGKVTLLGHAWGTFGETLFSTVMPALGGVVGFLTNVVNAATGVITILFQGDFQGGLFSAFGVAEDSPIVDFLFRIREGAMGLGDTLAPIFSAIGAAIGPLIPQFIELWTSFSPLSIVFQAIQPLLPQIAALFAELASTVGAALGPALQSLMAAIMPVAQALSGTFATVLQAILPIVMQLASTFAGILGQALTAILPVVTQLASVLGSVLGSVLTAISPLLTMLAEIIGQVLQAVLPLIQPILDLVLAIVPLIAPIVELVGALLTPLIELLTALLTPILGLISPLVDLLAGALGVVIDVLATVIGWVVEGIAWFVQLVTGSEQAGAQLNAVWGAIGSFFSDVWNNIVSFFRTGIDNVMRFVGDLGGKVLGALSSAGTWLVDVGKNIIQGLIDGVGSMIQNAIDAVLDVGGAMLDGIKGFLGIKSPSRVFRSEVGRQIGVGLAMGIADSQGLVSAAIDDLVSVPEPGSLVAPLARPAVSAADAASFGLVGDGIRPGSTLVLRVGEREFTAYVEEVSDARVAAYDSGRRQQGVRSYRGK